MADFELTSKREPRAKVRRGGWSWGPVEGAKLRVLSLGAGVQSTTLALMAAHGEIGPMPDAAIFADTGDEKEATYEHLRWLMSGNVLPFPVYRLDPLGNSLPEVADRRLTGGRYVTLPMFLDGPRLGQDRRQCTREFKADRLDAYQRQLLGVAPGTRIAPGTVELWIGFSVDEVIRATPAAQRWQVARHPLLEERMRRTDCEAWLVANGYPVPRDSKCKRCPFNTNAQWRWMKDNEPLSFAEAVDFDARHRQAPGMRARAYLHDSRRPLDQVDFSTAEDRGQGMLMVCDAGCGL